MSLVRQRIQYYNNGYLDLSNLNLTKLPENLPNDIKYLNIIGNNIWVLPKNLENSLKLLICEDYQLVFIDSKYCVSKLTELHCKDEFNFIPDITPKLNSIVNCSQCEMYLTRDPLKICNICKNIDFISKNVSDFKLLRHNKKKLFNFEKEIMVYNSNDLIKELRKIYYQKQMKEWGINNELSIFISNFI